MSAWRSRIERRGAPGLDVPATDKAKKPWRDGFVFRDVRETPLPFLVAPWLGERWLFYWSEDTHWTSFRRVTDEEAALYGTRAVKPKEAEEWHERHETWLEGVKRD